MTVSINLTQLKRKKRDDGTIPIYLRFTENRKSRYRSTGIAVPADCFTGDIIEPIKIDRQKRQKKGYDYFYRKQDNWNHDLRKDYRKIEDIRDDLERAGNLTLDTLLNEISDESGSKNNRDTIELAKKYRKILKADNRYWEHRHFKTVINNLSDYINDRNVSGSIDEMDAAWIEGFQSFLNNGKIGNNPNTVRKKLQRLKGMIHWLLKSKQIKADPFVAVDKIKPTDGDSKVKLSIEQMKKIEGLKLDRNSFVWHVRNYFMYSFYNAGIRFGDLCSLTWGDIIDGRLVYTMHKTGGKKSIGQLEPMYRILVKYVQKKSNYFSVSVLKQPENYPLSRADHEQRVFSLIKHIVHGYGSDHKELPIFPILKKRYSDPMELRKKIGSKNAQINLKLKDIAKMAGIQANVSFHVSRHSWAHFGLTKGMDLYSISKALGHSDLKVTQDYIKSFDEELLDQSMQNLYGV